MRHHERLRHTTEPCGCDSCLPCIEPFVFPRGRFVPASSRSLPRAGLPAGRSQAGMCPPAPSIRRSPTARSSRAPISDSTSTF